MNTPTLEPTVSRRNQRHGIEHRSLTLSLPGALATRLREFAESERLSMSRIVAEAVDKHLSAATDTESAA